MSVLIETSFGDITVDIWTDKAPKAALNFIKLCKMKHYNNALFIQVQKHHIARVLPQNPTTIWQLTGTDNQNKYFSDQMDHQLKFREVGYLATANKGPNLNNSQFFITLTKADLSSLNGKHTVFGKVQEGFEILRKINDSFCDKSNRPQMNIRILHTFILDDPLADLPNMEISIQSPQMIRNSNRLQAIQHLEMLQKYEKQDDINQTIKKQKAKKQAITLQIMGDLPDANIKPPENILFVCKLNPITQQRDLQIIFSRFGPIKSVQIVRDWKTGQSLQYGFIEFESQVACEEAYLKMNNVLIDDRRIQVDFSQSVSKLMPKNRKNNQPPKKIVKEQQALQGKGKQKLVKSGRRVDDDKFNLITSKPDYNSGNKYRRDQVNRERKEKVDQGNQKNEKIKPQSVDKEVRYRSQSQQQKEKNRKKDKKKKEKKNRRSSSSQSEQNSNGKMYRSDSSEDKAQNKKKHKIEKQRIKDKKDKKDKKQKKDKNKHKNRQRSESN